MIKNNKVNFFYGNDVNDYKTISKNAYTGLKSENIINTKGLNYILSNDLKSFGKTMGSSL